MSSDQADITVKALGGFASDFGVVVVRAFREIGVECEIVDECIGNPTWDPDYTQPPPKLEGSKVRIEVIHIPWGG